MRSASVLGWAVGLAVVLTAGAYGYNYVDAQRQAAVRAHLLTGGDPVRGWKLVQSYGCGGCHTIPRVPQAAGQVGPPLTGVGARVYLAGRLENRPENLVAWIQHPRAVDPQTVMPELGVTEAQARDIAAYLYTI
ncbi:MAG TPA: c-type cytochrome [Sphingomonas sp.]|nr:c-type cytochrome [Sphingomonas sp.]